VREQKLILNGAVAISFSLSLFLIISSYVSHFAKSANPNLKASDYKPWLRDIHIADRLSGNKRGASGQLLKGISTFEFTSISFYPSPFSLLPSPFCQFNIVISSNDFKILLTGATGYM
jgi:hypothetical protein